MSTPTLQRPSARLPFRVHFALAGKVDLFASSPDEARARIRERFPPAETGRITKVKRVKEKANG